MGRTLFGETSGVVYALDRGCTVGREAMIQMTSRQQGEMFLLVNDHTYIITYLLGHFLDDGVVHCSSEQRAVRLDSNPIRFAIRDYFLLLAEGVQLQGFRIAVNQSFHSTRYSYVP